MLAPFIFAHGTSVVTRTVISVGDRHAAANRPNPSVAATAERMHHALAEGARRGSSLPMRDANPLLRRARDRLVVPGVRVTNDAHSRIAREHALEPRRRFL